MQEVLAINNKYAAYSATSSNVDKKNVSALSRMLKADEAKEKKVAEAEMSMDKVIISSEALSLLKAQAAEKINS